jgi:hypothetical protein
MRSLDQKPLNMGIAGVEPHQWGCNAAAVHVLVVAMFNAICVAVREGVVMGGGSLDGLIVFS